MKKYMRNQVIELLVTVWEGVKKAKTLTPLAAEQVLADCYLAVQTIEKTLSLNLSEAGVHKYVCLFDMVKGMLEEINSDIAQGISVAENARKLKGHLKQLRKLLMEEPEVKLEAVFFPYKASMWDALESIWLAAKNDPQCNAIVVPIPYYDKNPDGSLGEMHYEGLMYPSCVPVVDWRAYDLATNRPDVAFIHNPYDNTNTLTQIPVEYFSANLKKYVGLLCYSPYFVVTDELTAHFATLPAVENADVVVVQSEEVRRQYLQVWDGMVKQNQAGMSELKNMQKKIVALGSPKFDAVTNAKRKDVELPDDWKRLIVRPDGTRKKVVFYNTSISSILTYTVDMNNKIDDRYLKKLESVLFYFRRRDDVVLLWRPHPLMEQTFATMRKPLYQRYLQIVRDYKQEGYGIYDDSADLHRAIAVSDVYYGDWSSVVSLWKETGKPLLINNVDVTDYQQRLVARNLYFDGDCFWCTALDFNGLFRIEKDTFKIHYVGQFSNEKREGYDLFSKTTECDGKLYCAPCNANNIGIYDKQTKEFSSIPLELHEDGCNKKNKYIEAFAYDKYVFITGCRIFNILKIDTQTNDITVIDNWKTQLLSHKNAEAPYLIAYGCQIEDKLYFPSRYANAMFAFDMRDCSSEIHLFNNKNRMYYRGNFIKDKIWICSNLDSSIGIYDIATGRTVDLDNHFRFNGFSDIRVCCDNVYCFSRHYPQILKIHSQTKQMQLFGTKENCDAIEIVGHTAYAVSYISGNIHRTDFESMEQQVRPMVCSAEMPEINCQNVLKESERYNNQYARETGFLNLDMLINIAKMPVAENKNAENCGETIYRYIKEMAE